MNLIFLGPPGSGKGTQSKFLEEKFGLTTIDTGNLIRDAIASKNEVGVQAESFVSKGRLVQDEIVVELIREKIRERRDNFILDGFPRNIRQAVYLDEILNESGIKIDYIINVTIDDKEILSRLSGRRVCKKCSLNYHIVAKTPKIEGQCDQCNGELYQRNDDREDVIRERMMVYKEMNTELVGYYSRRDIVKNINGFGSESLVSKRILDEIV